MAIRPPGIKGVWSAPFIDNTNLCVKRNTPDAVVLRACASIAERSIDLRIVARYRRYTP